MKRSGVLYKVRVQRNQRPLEGHMKDRIYVAIGQQVCIKVVIKSITQDKDGFKYTCVPLKEHGDEVFNSITVEEGAVIL